jgi:pimeloyl-ACP methyl ester carboxylesterase
MKKRLAFSLILCFSIFSIKAQQEISELVNYNLPVKTLKLSFEEIAYSETGTSDTTLVFVHGLATNLNSWQKNIPDLKNQFRCVALDLPGYGKSSKNKTKYSLKEYAEFIKEFIDKKRFENVVLVGHSMGGQIAMHCVLKNPETYKKLILLAPAGIETFTEQETAVTKASYTLATVTNATKSQIRTNYETNFYTFPKDAEPMVQERIAMKKATDFQDYAQVVVNNVHAMLNEPVMDDLEKIQQPVLLLFAKNDALIPNSYFHPNLSIASLAETAKENFKDLKVEIIDKAGHLLQFEQPGAVNKQIAEFVKQ